MFRITGFQSIQYRHMFNISIFHSSLMRERKFGECFHIGLALATMILTAVGVFGDVAVITVAPIAMVIGQRIGCSNFILLVALMGGEKAGMVISPNPNTIAAAENFGVDLSALMAAGIIPALVGLLLIGTGTISGIVKTSQFQTDMTMVLNAMNLPAFLLAPISGIVMAGATIASATFSETITQIVPALYGAAMLHAGTIVLDSLPHGSIFHASAGAMGMPINERMKLLPIDILEGFIIVLASTIVYGIIL